MYKTLRSGLIVLPLLLLTACAQHPQAPAPNEKVSIGIQASPAMALMMVAEDKGFFTDQGLDVTLQQFTAGKFALQAFLAGSLDYAVSGDVPVALAALQGNAFIVPAQVVGHTTNEVRVVAHKESGLTSAQEYFHAKKRKLATSIGGGPEFFTYQFLQKIGISPNDVQIISQTPSDMPAALANGSVDAISIFDPFAHIAEQKLGDNAVTFTDSSIYSELYVLEAHTSDAQNSARLEKILRALKQAATYTSEHTEDAQSIVMNYTHLDQDTVKSIWSDFDFSVTLTPKLSEYLNSEVQWAKQTGTAHADAPTPDFKTIISPGALQKVDPTAVHL